MQSQRFNHAAIKLLVGSTIVEAHDNYIKLDNGFFFYLSDSEIEFLNS
jgi:hypothetical protein